MFEDPDNIIEGYDPSNPVHNPAGYVRAMQEVENDIRNKAKQRFFESTRDKPGHFAKLHFLYWLLIIGLCFFVSYLFTL